MTFSGYYTPPHNDCELHAGVMLGPLEGKYLRASSSRARSRVEELAGSLVAQGPEFVEERRITVDLRRAVKSRSHMDTADGRLLKLVE